MLTEITRETTKVWTTREEQHHNGGKEFFAYVHRCVQQPRLSRYDRYERATRSSTSTWRVDGVDQVDLDAAIAALNIAPVFTAEELEILATVSDEPTDRRKDMLPNYELWNPLKEKGAVEWNAGKVHRTDLGRAALSKASPTQTEEG